MSTLLKHHEHQCKGYNRTLNPGTNAGTSQSKGDAGSSSHSSSTTTAPSGFQCFCRDMLNSRLSYLQHYNMKHPEATQRHASTRLAELHRLGLGPSTATASGLDLLSLKAPSKQAKRGMEWKGRRPDGSARGQGDGSGGESTSFKSLLMCSGEWLPSPLCSSQISPRPVK